MSNTLFSDYYLERLLPDDAAYRRAAERLGEVRAALRPLFADVASWAPDAPEAELEHRLVRPVLSVLGFEFLVQTPLRGHGIKTPDYLLYATSEGRRSAEGDRQNAAAYAIGLAEAKKWQLPLDRRGPGAGFDQANPSFQVDAYLRESDLDWGVLTNGRVWRLYHRSTSYRLDSYFELDLVEALDDDVELTAFAAFFTAGAFPGASSPLLQRAREESIEFASALGKDLPPRVDGAAQPLLKAPWTRNWVAVAISSCWARG